jgi:hypothetical protein
MAAESADAAVLMSSPAPAFAAANASIPAGTAVKEELTPKLPKFCFVLCAARTIAEGGDRVTPGLEV